MFGQLDEVVPMCEMEVLHASSVNWLRIRSRVAML